MFAFWTLVCAPLCDCTVVDYLRQLITQHKDGGHEQRKQAISARLARLQARDKKGLFQWVDELPGAGGHGYFIAMLRSSAVDIVRKHGRELFIDR
jgi:hypothetical protein